MGGEVEDVGGWLTRASWPLRIAAATGLVLALAAGVALGAGGLSVFPAGQQRIPDSIAAGPDGSLWFAGSETVADPRSAGWTRPGP